MTIKPIHTGEALTLEQYRAIEPELRRPLTDPPLGTSSYAKRSNDDAASRCFDEPDRPAGKVRWRAVGPAKTSWQLEKDDQTARNAARRSLSAPERHEPTERTGTPNGTPKRSQGRTASRAVQPSPRRKPA